LAGKLSPDTINPEDVHPTYRDLIAPLRDGKEIADLAAMGFFSAATTAKMAAEAVNGDVKPIEWLTILKNTASLSSAGAKLAKIAKKWEDGDRSDPADVLATVGMVDSGYREFTPMSEIEPEENMWLKTGYRPIDKHMGGFPKSSLTIMAASPGIGKTSLMLKIANSMVRQYKKQNVIIFTLEMTMAMLTRRMMDMDKSITKDEKSRLLLSESAYTVQEVYAEASRAVATAKTSLIAIDFADQLVEGEQSEAIMGVIYRSLSMLAKKTGVPVLLISQLNRGTYVGGIPRINHIRYSGMAEAMAALILLIYNPHNILADFAEKTPLPDAEGVGYIIAGKSRYGFKEGGPGAIQVQWDGAMGWGNESTGWWNL
jgi:replicative DNA helicase